VPSPIPVLSLWSCNATDKAIALALTFGTRGRVALMGDLAEELAHARIVL
jgi:hypothetical protein